MFGEGPQKLFACSLLGGSFEVISEPVSTKDSNYTRKFWLVWKKGAGGISVCRHAAIADRRSGSPQIPIPALFDG